MGTPFGWLLFGAHQNPPFSPTQPLSLPRPSDESDATFCWYGKKESYEVRSYLVTHTW